MERMLPCGENVPALGQGTWHIGDDASRRDEEIAVIRHGIDLGLTLIDTAEMYGDGRSEDVVGAAIEGRRDDVFLVSKVLPHHASRADMRKACEASLRRLRTDAIDLYLLHWPGAVPIAETVAGFDALQRAGKIRHWGVSNVDLAGMQELWRTPGGRDAQTNQVLYNLGERGTEWELQSWLHQHKLPLMAYSPFDEGRLLHDATLAAFARDQGMTPAQVALAWLLAQEGTIAIPKSGNRGRVEENAAALRKPLSATQLEELDVLFPPPRGPEPLAMI